MSSQEQRDRPKWRAKSTPTVWRLGCYGPALPLMMINTVSAVTLFERVLKYRFGRRRVGLEYRLGAVSTTGRLKAVLQTKFQNGLIEARRM
jgi:hypothetical protein